MRETHLTRYMASSYSKVHRAIRLLRKEREEHAVNGHLALAYVLAFDHLDERRKEAESHRQAKALRTRRSVRAGNLATFAKESTRVSGAV